MNDDDDDDKVDDDSIQEGDRFFLLFFCVVRVVRPYSQRALRIVCMRRVHVFRFRCDSVSTPPIRPVSSSERNREKSGSDPMPANTLYSHHAFGTWRSDEAVDPRLFANFVIESIPRVFCIRCEFHSAHLERRVTCKHFDSELWCHSKCVSPFDSDRLNEMVSRRARVCVCVYARVIIEMFNFHKVSISVACARSGQPRKSCLPQ